MEEGKKRKILVVDDEEWALDLIKRVLTDYSYEVLTAKNGIQALEKIYEHNPDLVLLDIRMPVKDGFEVLKEVKEKKEYRLLPIIVLTALDNEKVKAFNLGANDFLSKPFSHAELLARIKAHLRLKSYIERLEDAELILFTIAKIIELRDFHTEKHIERVTQNAIEIAKRMELAEEMLEDLRKGGRLHDIGKIAIPDRILLKNGKLSPEEFEIVKKHVIFGEEICRPLSSLRGALPIIRHHHERWDGKGYPDGLKGEEIPLLARIVAVADAFDAMINDRPYRKALSKEKALKILRTGAGTQWDPEIVEIFFHAVREGYPEVVML